MEYEFSRDTVQGGYHAKFSMEHELFSTWLVDEVADNKERLAQLQDCITRAAVAHYQDIEFSGREYLLTFNQQEVCLALNSSIDGMGGQGCFDDPHPQEDDINVNDDSFSNSCGLDDFALMLAAWRRFLNH